MDLLKYGFKVEGRAPSVEIIDWADLKNEKTVEALGQLCEEVLSKIRGHKVECEASENEGQVCVRILTENEMKIHIKFDSVNGVIHAKCEAGMYPDWSNVAAKKPNKDGLADALVASLKNLMNGSSHWVAQVESMEKKIQTIRAIVRF